MSTANMEIRQLRRAALLCLALVLALAQSPVASAAQYFYDAAGRLDTEVLDGGRALVYDYDDRGNVLRKRTVLFAALADAGDVDGDGVNDRAVLRYHRNDATPRVHVLSGAGGASPSTIGFRDDEPPVLFAVMPDVNASGVAELVLLVRDPSNRLRARVRDALSGNLLASVQFSGALTPIAMVAIGDLDGTGQRALAVLGRYSDGSLRAEVRNVPAGTLIAQIQYASVVQAAGFLALPRTSGVAELALLDRRDGGVSAIDLRRANGSASRKLQLGSGYLPQAFATLANADGAGTVGVAVLETNLTSGGRRVRLLRAADGVLLGQPAYSGPVPLGLAAASAQGAAPAAVAVTGLTALDRIRATVMQAVSGAALATISFDAGFTPVAIAMGRHDATQRSVDFLGLDADGVLRLTAANADSGATLFSIAVP